MHNYVTFLKNVFTTVWQYSSVSQVRVYSSETIASVKTTSAGVTKGGKDVFSNLTGESLQLVYLESYERNVFS